MKKSFIYIFSLLILFSCKNEKKNPNHESLKIIVKARILEDDKFQVFYIDGVNKGYTENRRIWKTVKGSKAFQEITFLLPTIPTEFRIDIGENRHESIVEISKIILDDGNNQIEIKCDALHRFFKPNIYTKKVDCGYLRMVIDNRYDPFISSSALLNKKMELNFKGFF